MVSRRRRLFPLIKNRAADAAEIITPKHGISNQPAFPDAGPPLRRGQQLFLGTASPFAAAVSNLAPTHWHLKTSPEGGWSAAGSQLQVMLAAGEESVWQSITLDAPPAGAYRLSIVGEWEGATQAIVQASIRSANDRDAVLGSAELNLALPGSWPFNID
jgi:hypothetical protein